jgi:hypothetical protein
MFTSLYVMAFVHLRCIGECNPELCNNRCTQPSLLYVYFKLLHLKGHIRSNQPMKKIKNIPSIHDVFY